MIGGVLLEMPSGRRRAPTWFLGVRCLNTSYSNSSLYIHKNRLLSKIPLYKTQNAPLFLFFLFFLWGKKRTTLKTLLSSSSSSILLQFFFVKHVGRRRETNDDDDDDDAGEPPQPKSVVIVSSNYPRLLKLCKNRRQDRALFSSKKEKEGEETALAANNNGLTCTNRERQNFLRVSKPRRVVDRLLGGGGWNDDVAFRECVITKIQKQQKKANCFN